MLYVKNSGRFKPMIIALGNLCLMMSFGCSMRPAESINCPLAQIPSSLLTPTQIPVPEIQKWGDYPDYTVVLHQAITACNTDKAAIHSLLKRHVPQADSSAVE